MKFRMDSFLRVFETDDISCLEKMIIYINNRSKKVEVEINKKKVMKK